MMANANVWVRKSAATGETRYPVLLSGQTTDRRTAENQAAVCTWSRRKQEINKKAVQGRDSESGMEKK